MIEGSKRIETCRCIFQNLHMYQEKDFQDMLYQNSFSIQRLSFNWNINISWSHNYSKWNQTPPENHAQSQLRRMQLNFMLYGPKRPQFLANQNDNTDFPYNNMIFFFLGFLFLLLFYWFYFSVYFFLGCNKIDKKQNISALYIVESRRKQKWSLK